MIFRIFVFRELDGLNYFRFCLFNKFYIIFYFELLWFILFFINIVIYIVRFIISGVGIKKSFWYKIVRIYVKVIIKISV